MKGVATRVSVAIALVALVGCSTAHQYRRATHELMTQNPHYWCWTSIENLSAGKGWQCDSKLSRSDEAECIQSLTASTTHRPALEVAMEEVDQCMHDKGWGRYPFAFAPRTKRIPRCLDEYPPERCPYRGIQQ